ncbi:MAG: polyprenyl synthetase family protein [Saprospiraceae bacterium]
MQNPSQFGDLYLSYLKENPFKKAPEGLYLPADYIMELGGKRFRPQLALWGTYLRDGDVNRALPIAHSVEVFHNFTLVHDDIMDDANLRRGMKTVHEKFGTNSAILSGDVMMIKAYEYLQKGNNSHLGQLLKIFNRVAIEVCEGQQMDMDFESRSDVTISEYLRMIELKTSALLGGALLLGSVNEVGEIEGSECLDTFGRWMGVAFQIQDDYLDTFGDPEKFGKKVGGDIIQNKKTILYLKAMELAGDTEKQELESWFEKNPEDPTEKVEAVSNLFTNLGVKEEILNLQDDYIKRARACLENLDVDESKRNELSQWALAMVDRNV